LEIVKGEKWKVINGKMEWEWTWSGVKGWCSGEEGGIG